MVQRPALHPRSRAARVAIRIGLVVAAVVVMAGALEVVLRWRPTLLGREFANGALSRYTVREGGIYYRDRSLRMNFMIPNHRATMYANGYVWQHQTDALGFRNDPLHVPADVILLGDSLVYGHGVEFEDTLGHRLEERSGLRVANLGRQGDCTFQEAYLLTEYIGVFRPRFVVHVFTPNDIEDLYVHLSDAAMEAFLAQPVEAIRYPARVPTEVALRQREQQIRRRPLWKRIDEESYVLKMGRFIQYLWHAADLGGGVRVAAAAPSAGRRVDFAQVRVDPTSLGWRYTEHAIAYMTHLSRRHGARFVIVPVTTGRQFEILRDIAERRGATFVDTRAFLATSWGLPNDGHFSPEGARRLAGLLASVLGR
jgi:hypothetical protein